MKTFDYIIVGAGTAGGVIVKELSDDPKISVLVLEAGTNWVNSSPSMLAADRRANDSKLSFSIFTKTEDVIARQMRLRSGRVIGGGSQLSFMGAVRGSRELYDHWARLVDGEQWNYDHVRRLFIKNETYTGGTESPEERGNTGPIFIRQQHNPASGLIQTFTRATSEVLGIPIKQDYNTGIRDVTFYPSQFTQRPVGNTFIRSSTATGYLNESIVTQGNEFHPDAKGIGKRKLFIWSKTTVNKILFKKQYGSQVAVGVEFVRNGVSDQAFARRGVVVSAGLFSSVILQRSGIGKREDLLQAGITPLIESPLVGREFQTHYYVPMGVEVETKWLLQVLDADPAAVAIGAFKKDDGPGRRLQLLGFPGPSLLPIHDVILNQWEFDQVQPVNVMSIAISDLNPKSRGTILAVHSDPEAAPTIELHPLEHPDDLRFIIDGYIETFKIIERARELDPDGGYKVVYPPESIFRLKDEAKKRSLLARYAKATYTNYDHFGGHCRMGTSIQTGVVDGFLNVFGTRNLKVADLSIAPILPDGQPSIAAQMIGLNSVKFLRPVRTFSLVDED